MKRVEVLISPEYWMTVTQIDLYNQVLEYMEKTGMDEDKLRNYLSERLCVSKGCVSKLLNSDYDHRLSKFFELALALGIIPVIDFVPIEDYIQQDSLT